MTTSRGPRAEPHHDIDDERDRDGEKAELDAENPDELCRAGEIIGDHRLGTAAVIDRHPADHDDAVDQ